MPKCTFPGCDQTAFYGQIFNQPKFCKLHVPAGSGSVKKKCTWDECQNAVFGHGDLCARCREVNIVVARFTDTKLSELNAEIKKENAFLSSVTQSTTNQQPVVVVPVKKVTSTKPVATCAQPNMFAPKETQGSEQGQQNLTITKPKSSGKVVRIPDEIDKAVSELALAKKRTQTPGRPKIAQLPSDAKNESMP